MGTLLGIDAAIEAWWPWAKSQLDRVSIRIRRKLEIAVFVISIFYAGFAAWNEGHDARIKAEQRIPINPYHWALLSPEEIVSLRAEIRKIPPQSIAIMCNEDDCGDLARSVKDVFKDLNWKVVCCAAAGWNRGRYLSLDWR